MGRNLTFAGDVELDPTAQTWIPRGTVVKVSTSNFNVELLDDHTAVIITEAYNMQGKLVRLKPTIEFFNNRFFVETMHEVIK